MLETYVKLSQTGDHKTTAHHVLVDASDDAHDVLNAINSLLNDSRDEQSA